MDGSSLDHSDSDSGESWTLLDNSPVCADDAPDFPENSAPLSREPPEVNVEKDEDTDGISVISDSEPESSIPCNISFDSYHIEESCPLEDINPQIVSVNPLTSNNITHHETIRSEDDLLGDSRGKHKTYVHRRNKRLSTVLNIIMLGSVITAAGVAIGHMWGARYDCAMHSTHSVNKILSNLYKLQEENAYLRNKLKELTLAGSVQFQQRKLNVEKLPFKQQRCKKIYEVPLNSKNADIVTKCIDDNENVEQIFKDHMVQPQYEKDFIKDIDKLKNIYQQNKSWLDDEIARRLKNEEYAMKKMASNNKLSLLSSISEEQKGVQDDNMNKEKVQLNRLPTEIYTNIELLEAMDDVEKPPLLQKKKITYADSLKSDQNPHKIEKRETNVVEKVYRQHINKRKNKKENDIINVVLSEEELKKDDRYVGQKTKQDKKKRDRQKLHKKQKRKNKYEQWEMKGGYMKDFDEFSISSSQDNENVWRKPDKNHLSRDFEKINYINQFSETDNMKKPKIEIKKSEKHDIKTDSGSAKNVKNDDLDWFDKRSVLRTEARKRLEHELFGESSPNNAGWYFRRMQRREQCRTKADNGTYRKLTKRNMNFKMKH